MNIADKRAAIISKMLSSRDLITADPCSTNHTTASEKEIPEPVAIVGLSGFLPQSMSVDEFWRALDEDKPLIDRVPEDRFNWQNVQSTDEITKRWGGVIPNIKLFDPKFFGIMPSEAKLIDPRKRLLLMSVYHTLEDAGYAPKSLEKSKTGVFIAAEENEYLQRLRALGLGAESMSEVSSSLLANQISYHFNFRGPSEFVDTMCSGAAVAIQRAVSALRSEKVTYAVVGAANLLLSEDTFHFLAQTGQMSSTDSVKSFGKEADGYLRADGVASILLKRLSEAEADNDPIYAIIKNVAVNYNGKGGMSMATPNIAAHADLIKDCYREVKVNPGTIDYLEAQGMGNPVADIAEWEAFNRALKGLAKEQEVPIESGSCRVSTLKPMIGHMHATSALGALFKVIRSFQTNTIHQVIGLKAVNPALDTAGRPCRLVTETEHWLEADCPRLAGVHSYGSGGNNAHLLVEEYKKAHSEVTTTEDVVIPCSAATRQQCKAIVRNLLNTVKQSENLPLASIAHTMQVGRDAMQYRVAFVANKREIFIQQAEAYLQGEVRKDVFEGEVFSDQAFVPSQLISANSIAQAWANGQNCTWEKLVIRKTERRLHLPTYPFDHQEYWVDQPDTEAWAPVSSLEECKDVKATAQYGNQRHEAVKDHLITHPAEGTEVWREAERIVRELLSSFLLVPPFSIEINQEFSTLGFNSLLVAKMSSKLESKYKLTVASAIFFEHTTPRQLINFISEEFSEQLEKRYSLNTNKQRATAEHLDTAVSSSSERKANSDRKHTDKIGARYPSSPIAIVGVSGRFPQAPTIENLWQNLTKGKNCVREVPHDRWSLEDNFSPDKEVAYKSGKSYGKWGGFIEDYYHFDPLFFNISPLETELMSPKERLFLQCAWHVLEDAGYTPDALTSEQVGVFAGVTRGGTDPYKTSMFTIANRVSYVLNLHGPSMTLDTACSSSLVAIHEACQHIRAGECSVALAGGVHVFLDPSHFAVLSSMYMLSPDGSSKAFGDQANGMVPGEGVGIVMLKPLEQALSDQDAIYGVIKGSAINHGGKTNGFTVPNPKAQQNLIQKALANAQVNARDISYVEAHGTGTPLGDPIEIRGLTEAFKTQTAADTQYCRIGSLKTNIGHLEAAAGVAGLIKVLLQMKHQQLVPSLHSQKLNTQIDFSQTPFQVQQLLEDWQPKDTNGDPIARRACVSSFGAGGANANVIIEEYQQAELGVNALPVEAADGFCVLLSAKHKNQLKEQAKQLLNFLETNPEEQVDLADLTYTLQVGRVAWGERLAFKAHSTNEIKARLTYFLEKREERTIYQGSSKDYNKTIALFADSTTLVNVINEWIHAKNLDKLLDIWTKGINVDWYKLYDHLYNTQRPRRVSLPGYPFAKEFYGLPEVAHKSLSRHSVSTALHPLVHLNTSNFSTQRFSTTLAPEMFFLRDHVINGENILPGVAYLEMARAALVVANTGVNGASNGAMETATVHLRNFVWVRPKSVKEATMVEIALTPQENGEVTFKIYTPANEICPENTIHSQGSAQLGESGAVSTIDLPGLKKSLSKHHYSAAECYETFSKMGIDYGETHRGIKEVQVGEHQLLAKIALPHAAIDTLNQFCIHPSLLDAAFQSIICFMMTKKEQYPSGFPLPVPFSAEEVSVFSACTTDMWARVSINDGVSLTGNLNDFDNLSFNIDLTDASGEVCVRIKGYRARVLGKSAEDKILMQPIWKSAPVAESPIMHYSSKVVVLCEEIGRAEEAIIRQVPKPRVMTLRSEYDRIEKRIEDYAIRLLEEVQRLLKRKLKDDILIQLVVPASKEHRVLAALYGLLNTAAVENPKIHGQLIAVENISLDELVDRIEENSQLPGQLQVRYMNGNREQKTWQPYLPKRESNALWKDEGVYLITGGMGALGAIFAAEIIRRASDVKVILTGRSELNTQQQERLKLLNDGSASVIYQRMDVSHPEAVNELVEDIYQKYGNIHGIIHCAGILRDSFILKKEKEEVSAVLSPKVKGVVNLDEATKHIDLDVFVLCSSTTAVIGNMGQADYAIANAFMDYYASYRNSLVSTGERVGHTVSVNWPLWQEGGMQVDEATKKKMYESMGMVPLDTAVGLQALYDIWEAKAEQMIVVQGSVRKIKGELLSTTHEKVSQDHDLGVREKETPIQQTALAQGTQEEVTLYLKKLLSSVMKLPLERIDADASLDEYGIDSIVVIQLTNELEKVFGSLSKTLFFEYHSIDELTEYFLESHSAKVAALVGIANTDHQAEKVIESNPMNTEKASEDSQRKQVNTIRIHPERESPTKQQEDIAIIGLSGRYPKAANVSEFWNNLKAGKNCVTEIPKERWNHSLYFDEDKNKTWATYSKWGGFIDDVDKFDSLFFRISPKEALVLDPQERLFLQCAYETIEDAGYTGASLGNSNTLGLPGNVGVYVGVMWQEYQLYGAQETAMGRPLALSSSPSSIANRVSYFFNFHGPSMAVDTMCSSSLTAIHLACKSIQNNECEVALAGGVNVSIHPNKYLVLGYGKIASSRGLCESFGTQGDGYVPSEGVGAILLKPLSKAISDHDNIYGVIKGSAVNHGGKVNSFTVPNPVAQANVIDQAIKIAGISPQTINYLEAHGTGTPLGDPIEIKGLTKAFATQDRQFCAIGSVKSNIGHCESAAGIAGLTKVLLQMRHQQLVPSIHSKELNPYIDFANSPFVVQQELTKWMRPVVKVDGQIKEYPRRAGVSSFGAGGANAHVIIEEYVSSKLYENHQAQPVNFSQPPSFFILLSARSLESLRKKAEQLSIAIKETQDICLADIAYTLQVGREVMEERLAAKVDSVSDLTEKLEKFVREESNIPNLYYNKVTDHKGVLGFLASDDDIDVIIERWVAKKKYGKLLELWTKGGGVNWNKLYNLLYGGGQERPYRMSLPTYPFAKIRHWPNIKGSEYKGLLSAIDTTSTIHPLIHQNTSTFSEQRFDTTFSGKEFFLQDHIVHGEKLLPGVAYLEMVNKAMKISTGQTEFGILLENIVWMQPLSVNGHPKTASITLQYDEEGAVGFEVYTRLEEHQASTIIHSQGKASFTENQESIALDIAAIKRSMHQVVTADQCYELFKSMGITYGPAQRGIEHILVGEKQLLAKLKLPEKVTDTLSQYQLHPSMLDASLQSVIGFLEKQEVEDISAAVPFAIRSVEVLGDCTSEMWAFVRYTEDNGYQQPTQLAFDIDLCDDSGRVCVLMKGFTSRVAKREGQDQKKKDILMITPGWDRKKIDIALKTINYVQHLVIVLEQDKLATFIAQQLPTAVVKLSSASDPSIDAAFEEYAIFVFEEVKALLASRPKDKILVQVVAVSSQEPQAFLAIAALFKTAHFENPLFTGQVIELESGYRIADVAGRLRDNSQIQDDTVIRYSGSTREVLYLQEHTPNHHYMPATHPWKDEGVYLITGGMGSLGLIFAEDIAQHTQNAVIILTGRSLLRPEQEEHLEKVRSFGAIVFYQLVDVTDKNSVDALVKTILRDFGSLNCVIHSAGIIRDNFILKKSTHEIKAVLAPKVQGTINLDIATQHIPLDFFITFSSSAGVTGNAGQADYSVANAFMDHYIHYRNTLVATKERSGRSLSINWPLWKDGGMHIAKEQKTLLLETTGMMPLTMSEGKEALYRAVQEYEGQIMILKGEIEKLRSVFMSSRLGENEESRRVQNSNKKSEIAPLILSPEDQDKTYTKMVALNYFRNMFSKAIALPSNQINVDHPMEDYGVDSIMVMQMTNELEKVFGSLSKTLFFEYQSIRDLVGYFIEEFPEIMMSLSDTSDIAMNNNTLKPSTVSKKVYSTEVKQHRFTDVKVQQKKKETDTSTLDIAIIGVSGRYPQAKDVDEFWQILKEGKNCITEAPKSHWNHGLYRDSRLGGFLDDIDKFDPLFFAISAKEAERLDPQERLFIQCAYQCIEDAAYTRQTLGYNEKEQTSGNVGVYVGVMWNEYQLYGAQETALGRPTVLSGISASIANRVSYFCNFNGPSITLNTMCSSSLTAIHLACQSLHRGECEVALAGGVNLAVHPNKYEVLEYGNFLSSKGLCESFGAQGDGYVPGEGVGAILLKPLSQAAKDRDQIYGVIKGSALNHGGKVNGFTVPNPRAQAKAIKKAIKMANIDPQTISYVEAHGTGTALGDPIEIAGLKKAFATQNYQFCAIGSVKSNIGHSESAAGIAGVTKVLLQMKHQQLVPSLHSKKLNPHIDFANSPFVVQQELEEWKRPIVEVERQKKEYPRRAGVSSFGAGGANAHVIIEEYIPIQETSSYKNDVQLQKSALIVLSARNIVQLKRRVEELITWKKALAELPPELLLDIAYTLQVGREAMKQRVAFEISSFQELEEKMVQYLSDDKKVANMYSGEVYNTTDILDEEYVNSEKRQVAGWIASKDYKNMLAAWVKGIKIDWHMLYVEVENGKTYKPKRISLPTYPFATEHYWVPGTAASEILSKQVISSFQKQHNHADPAPTKAIIQEESQDDELLQERVSFKLKSLFSAIVKYSAYDIDEKEPLENYGIDSVMIVELNTKLSEVYGELPTTLFYEYQTLETLAKYLVQSHYEKSRVWIDYYDQVKEESHQKVDESPKVTSYPNTLLSKKMQSSENTYFSQVPSSPLQEPVAIIGMSGRYPNASNLGEFWMNLKEGKNCIREIPADRWDINNLYYSGRVEGIAQEKSYSKWGGFIEDFASFDSMFFNIAPREAVGMDPHARLFIESSWHVLEDAGYTKEKLADLADRNVGVFAGITRAGFYSYTPELMKRGVYTLNTMSAIANRVSYAFDLKGPSVPIDTMCSSSLTAIHKACESLSKRQCKMAIAGGVNLLLHPLEYEILSANNFLSTEGKCRSFGAGGDGYVPGEGVGTVLLKPLSEAIEDRDHIYAVIRGTNINHGGKTNGYTVPNPVAQGELIRSALDNAGVHARAVSYIEAHGTGTSLGDPIEITGLTQAFSADTPDTQYCAIGSAKSSIGHLEAAAGIAGLTKVVLQMQHKMLVPSLHAKTLNPNIHFEKTPFYVQQTLSEWQNPTIEVNDKPTILPRIAGISSFGAGGANAHVILEEYMPTEKKEHHSIKITPQNPVVVLLSARDQDRLKTYAIRLLTFLEKETPTYTRLLDIAYTLQVGRESMEKRLALLVSSVDMLTEKLNAFVEGRKDIEDVWLGSTKEHKNVLSRLNSDRDMAITVGNWLEHGKYSKVLDLWSQGLQVNWDQLYNEQIEPPRRISLPPYPFLKKKHWFTELPQPIDMSSPHEVLIQANQTEQNSIHKPARTLLLKPIWEKLPDTSSSHDDEYAQKIVVLCNVSTNLEKLIRQYRPEAHIVALALEKEGEERTFSHLVEQLFDTVQQLFKSKPKGKILLQVILPEQADTYLPAGVTGFLKSARLENPKLIGQVIHIHPKESPKQIMHCMEKGSIAYSNTEIRCDHTECLVNSWKKIELPDATPPWQDKEVYLITGGLGKLGMLCAKDIAKHTNQTTLILTGRSVLDEVLENKLEALQQTGATIVYRRVDVTDRRAVTDLLKEVQQRYGGLHGILHIAGSIKDNYLINKSKAEFLSVLNPKVQGVVNLDEASATLPLRFFVLFSSISSALGNPGQTDYSAGNAFMDEYSYYRNTLVSNGWRHGQTLSINWPLWKDGGMKIDLEAVKFMKDRMGMEPLTNQAGLMALYQALQSRNSQVMVLYGKKERIQEQVLDKQVPTEKSSKPLTVSMVDSLTLYKKVLEQLKVLFGEVVGMESSEVDEEDAFELYGIDSIMITKLNQRLDVLFDGLSRTLFYEYTNLKDLTDYLVEDYQPSCAVWVGMSETESITEEPKYVKVAEQSIENQSAPTDVVMAGISPNVEKDNEPLAIIGMSGRYPRSNSLEEFWENLKTGRDCITEIPKDRWDMSSFYHPIKEEAANLHKSYSKWGGFIDGFSSFDPLFFNISTQEALAMDPQERLFLQSCWEVFEDAGYTRRRIAEQFGGRIGVFAGITKTGFELYGSEFWETEKVYPRTSFSSIANRVSYFFNLNGPSVPIDTMCSSSLTAVHEACENIRRGTCELAIAGGVNTYLHPSSYLGLSSQFFLSTDGKCRSFGAGGDGFVPGEGVGTILLKPLSKAIVDGDHIYALIRGTYINHGGKTNGYTVPNPNAQANLVREALVKSNVNARAVSYIEAHGTGTSLGDPIEITGLTQAFSADTPDTQYCAIGSAKSSIGHLEAAAGIAGLTKVVLQMQHKMLVPSLHAKTLNPNIHFEKTPFYVQQTLSEWQNPTIEVNDKPTILPRIAGISSFGAGGANAHVILEEYMPTEKKERLKVSTTPRPTRIIILSAKSIDRLKNHAEKLLNYITIERYTDDDLIDIAYTLQIGREPMDTRLGLLADSITTLRKKLMGFVVYGKETKSVAVHQAVGKKEKRSGYQKDEDFQDLMDTWISKGKYEKLIEFWLKGVDTNWKKLYEDTEQRPPKVISLPTYPFEQEHLWISSTTNRLLKVPMNEVSPNIEESEVMTFEETLQEQPLPESAQLRSNETLVCFLSKHQHQWAVQQKIQTLDTKAKIVFVSVEEDIEPSSLTDYCLNSHSEDEYKSIFQKIKKHYGSIDGILYLLPWESEHYSQNYLPIFSIICAIDSEKLRVKKLMLSGYWENTQFDHSLTRCFLEAWVGIERTAKMVLPDTDVICLYYELRDESVPTETWTEKLWWELGVANSRSVLYRTKRRYVYQSREIPLKEGEGIIRQGGTYIITGGLGGLGLLFAEHLAKEYQAKLVLIGRSALDANKKESIKGLEKAGAQVMYVQADVSYKDKLQLGLDQVKRDFGTINGLVHAAGIASEVSIFEQDIDHFNDVLRPKIQATILLDDLLSDEPLDFVSYFSSSAAIIGDFGACCYAMGNRFQMAYARYRRALRTTGRRKGKTVVINWPLWKDGGMGFTQENARNMYLKSSGQRLLEDKEGINLFEQLLLQDTTQFLVLAGKPTRIRQFLGLTSQKVEELPVETVENTVMQMTQKKEVQKLSIKEHVIADLKDQVNTLLKIPVNKIRTYENMVDFGFDSIRLTQFARMLSKYYGIEITPALFFSYSTLEGFADYLLGNHEPLMKKMYQAAETPDTFQEDTKKTAFSNGGSGRIFSGRRSLPAPVDLAEPIAIIGMSGRFPEARNVEEMWKIVSEGQDVVREIPSDRFRWQTYYGGENIQEGKMNCKWSGLVPGLREFDPLFFEISPKEAKLMDPRQRLLLQEAWKALEDAGYGSEQIKESKIGLYVGAEESSYASLARQGTSITANHGAVLSARLSYFLNLSGPNMTINTACSSGLVAIHQACLSLRNYECDTALAAGVSLLFTHEPYVAMSQAGMLSKDGRCYAFDKRANGIVPGEAIATVVLKRLSKAYEDGDPIYATIVGSKLNYDGKTNGITAPSGVSQMELLKSVYDQYEINPKDIEYVVTHGTGTKLGDPVEVNALRDAFQAYTDQKSYCALTSTKTNFGHTLAASGIVNVINLVQALQHETIPPSLHCREENDYINWKDSPFYVNKENRSWPEHQERPRFGAVSAFGMSGTNAHLVIRSYPKERTRSTQQRQPFYLVVLSAKNPESLSEKIIDMVRAMEETHLSEASLEDISYTLLSGRHHFQYRCAIVAQSVEDATLTWRKWQNGEKCQNLFQGEVSVDFKRRDATKEYVTKLVDQLQHTTLSLPEYQQALCALADSYCQGYEMAARVLYEQGKRIHLPTYPFLREHYWVEEEGHDIMSDAKQQYSHDAGTTTLEVKNEDKQVQNDKVLKPLINEVTSGVAKENGNGITEEATAQDFDDSQTKHYIKNFVSTALDLPLERIEEEVALERYGIDSILTVQLKNQLEGVFGELPANLFYDYPTITDLTEYFTNNHLDTIQQISR